LEKRPKQQARWFFTRGAGLAVRVNTTAGFRSVEVKLPKLGHWSFAL
jgi:hypothetical protein